MTIPVSFIIGAAVVFVVLVFLLGFFVGYVVSGGAHINKFLHTKMIRPAEAPAPYQTKASQMTLSPQDIRAQQQKGQQNVGN